MCSLPELALIRIFNHLPLYDRLAIRLVCKEWKQLIEEQLPYSTKELVLFYLMEPRPLIWHHCDQPVNLDNAIIVNCKFKSSECFRRLFCGIKRLYIAAHSKDITYKGNGRWGNIQEDFFDQVNCFVKLEHFELYHSISVTGYSQRPEKDPFEINLKELKTFRYETDGRDRLTRRASPKLEQLACFDDFFMNANFDCFRNSLKFLKVRSFSCESNFELPNLEQLFFSKDLQIEIIKFSRQSPCQALWLANLKD